MIRILASLSILGLLVSGACTHVYTAHGAYYRVRKGDTLESVAQRYKISAQDLAEVNNVESSEEIRPGTSLYIPGVTPSNFAAILKKEGIPVRSLARTDGKGRKETKEVGKKPSKDSKERIDGRSPEKGSDAGESEEPIEEPAAVEGTVRTERGRFTWPLEGDISSLYGMRRGRRHDGIDIRAKTGTPVYAAAEGEVVYSKRMRGYGNLVLIKHDEDFFTVYAHNSVNLVKVGMKVKKGQMVSRVGRTGRATGPHLHFEVREGAKSRNPLFFLPKTMFAQKAKEKKGIDTAGLAEGEGDGDTDGEAEAENP